MIPDSEGSMPAKRASEIFLSRQRPFQRALDVLRILLLVVLVFNSAAIAQPKESLESIKGRYDRQRQDIAGKLRTQKIELMKLMALDNPNSDHIKKKLTQILETEEERQCLFVDEMFAVRQAMSEQEWRDYRRSVIFMMMDKKSR